MSETSIQWTDHSTNPIRARRAGITETKGGYNSGIGHYCEKISSGCANCYSSTTQPRFGLPKFPGVVTRTGVEVLQNATCDVIHVSDKMELFFDQSRLEEVMRRKKPTKYFWCDMTDLFGPWVPTAWIDRCFATMALTPQHTHQILTKRAGRMVDYVNTLTPLRLSASERFGMPIKIPEFPLSSVWLGFSAEDQQRWDQRLPDIEKLADMGWLTWCSAEPLLGHINMGLGSSMLRWLVCGGESGHGARPCHIEWIRSIVKQCKAAGVACFVKQLGSLQLHPSYRIPNSALQKGMTENDEIIPFRPTDPKGGDISEFPEDLRIREFPITRTL